VTLETTNAALRVHWRDAQPSSVRSLRLIASAVVYPFSTIVSDEERAAALSDFGRSDQLSEPGATSWAKATPSGSILVSPWPSDLYEEARSNMGLRNARTAGALRVATQGKRVAGVIEAPRAMSELIPPNGQSRTGFDWKLHELAANPNTTHLGYTWSAALARQDGSLWVNLAAEHYVRLARNPQWVPKNGHVWIVLGLALRPDVNPVSRKVLTRVGLQAAPEAVECGPLSTDQSTRLWDQARALTASELAVLLTGGTKAARQWRDQVWRALYPWPVPQSQVQVDQFVAWANVLGRARTNPGEGVDPEQVATHLCAAGWAVHGRRLLRTWAHTSPADIPVPLRPFMAMTPGLAMLWPGGVNLSGLVAPLVRWGLPNEVGRAWMVRDAFGDADPLVRAWAVNSRRLSVEELTALSTDVDEKVAAAARTQLVDRLAGS
jgi:hypothetical protein